MALMVKWKLTAVLAPAVLLLSIVSSVLFISPAASAVDANWQACYSISTKYPNGFQYSNLTQAEQNAYRACFDVGQTSGRLQQAGDQITSIQKTNNGGPACTSTAIDGASVKLSCIDPVSYENLLFAPIENVVCSNQLDYFGGGGTGYDTCVKELRAAYPGCSAPIAGGATGSIERLPIDIANCIKSKVSTTVTAEDIATAISGGREAQTAAEAANQAAVDAVIQASCSANPTTDVCGGLKNDSSASTCKVDGIGWIVCPVITFLANVADGAMGQVKGFLDVPAKDYFEQGGEAHQYWEVMRNYANVMFVIAFVVVIFSQVTSIGISNYGIKKLLPKLIVVALLVNLSWYISVLAVDVSNFLGYSFSGLFNAAIDTAITTDEATAWHSSEQGGLVGLGASAILLVVGGAAAVTAYFFLAAFFGVILTFIVTIVAVFVVLTIREAAIIVLVVASPVAFATMLLPNTEGVFKKWLGIFKALLVLFPIIGLLYGAAKLASKIIVSSAEGNMFVQLIGSMLPFLILITIVSLTKKALNLIDGLDGVANGIMNKGSSVNNALLGNLRKGDDERRQILGNRLGRSAIGKPFVNASARRGAHLEAQKAELDQIKQSHLLNDPRAQGYAVRQQTAQKLATAAQTQAGTNALTTLASTTSGQAALLAEEAAKKKAEIQQADVDTMLIKNARISGLDNAAKDAQMTKSLAEQQRSISYYSGLQTDVARQQAIGTASGHTQGIERVAATVKSQATKAFNDNVDMEKSTMTKLAAPALQSIVRDTSASTERRAAAASMIAKGGGDTDIHTMLDYLGTASGTGIAEVQQQVASDIGQRKPAAVGAADMSAMARGDYSGDFTSKIDSRLKKGKLSGEAIAHVSADELDKYITYAQGVNKSALTPQEQAAFTELANQIRTFRTDPVNASKQPAKEITQRMDQLSGLL